MKKIIVTLLLAALVLAAVPALAQNAFTAANGGIVPTIQFVTYEGFGFVEVDFLQDVNYENPTVAVTDASGAPVTAAIVQLDDDDLAFQITDFAADAAYNFTISGVRVGRNGSYTSVSDSFTVPPKVEYDRDDREIDIEFAALVQYENPTVQVIAADGTPINATIYEWDEDSIEARLESPLNLGSEYMVTVTGVRAAQDTAFGSASLTFTAYDD